MMKWRERESNPHLNMYSFISVLMGERRRKVDERHDAQAVIHQGDIWNDNTHGGLWRGEEVSKVLFM